MIRTTKIKKERDGMTKFYEKYYVERRKTDSLKWDGMEEKFGTNDLLPLWVADMDFKVPETVQQKMTDRIDHGVFGYSIASDDYYQSVIDWQKKRHGVEIQSEWIRFGTGVVNGLHYLIQCFTKEEDSVMIFSPVYYPFYDVVKENKRKLVVSELVIKNGRYEIDFDDMERKIKENSVKAIIFCSPHNPVGRVWTKNELDKVNKICQEHDVFVISDEIHQDFIAKGQTFTSFLNVDGIDEKKLVILNSASKSFNLASLLHSHILIPSEELRGIYDVFIKSRVNNPPSLMGMIATQTSYNYGEKWLNELNETIDSNFILMKKLFHEILPEAVVYDKEGTYLSWIDLGRYCTEKTIEDTVQAKAKIAIDYGSWFGKNSGTFIRVNLATHPKNIEKAVHALGIAIKNS